LWDHLGWWTYLAVVGGPGPSVFLSELAVLPLLSDGADHRPGIRVGAQGPGGGAGDDGTAQREHGRLARQTTLRLDAPAEFEVEPLKRVGRAHALPLAGRIAVERQQLLAGLVEASDDARTALAPLLYERGVGAPGGRAILGADDRMVVGPQLVMQALGRGGEEIAQLVDGAALNGGLGPCALHGRPQSLLELLDDRHGTRATSMTSQLPIAQWHAFIGDPTLPDSICDRLLHNAHRIVLKGPSRSKEGKLES
jgi:hypothetical protein